MVDVQEGVFTEKENYLQEFENQAIQPSGAQLDEASS
jgi:hypothetical protein